MITKDAVFMQLREVIDPELQLNIVDLGLIYDIRIDQNTGIVAVEMTLTSPGCPLSYVFEELIPAACKKVEGVKEVEINLVWDPPWDPEKISEDAREELGMII
jgi:metal-sulfur cluster biosynthetic enzyme